MDPVGRTTVVGWLLRWADGLRFRTLTLVTIALFLVDPMRSRSPTSC